MKLHNFSIRRKVSLVVISLPVVTLLVFATGVLWVEQKNFRQQAETQLAALGSVVALAVNDAVVGFEPSRQDAEQALEALRARSEISEAHLFTGNDIEPFASIPADTKPSAEIARLSSGYHDFADGVWFVTPLVDERGRSFGRVAVHSSLAGLRAQQKATLVLFVAVFLASLGFAIALSIWLSRVLSRPLTLLSDRVAQIESSGDSNLRVPTFGADEVGRLASSINRMLEALAEQSSARQQSEERLKMATSAAHVGIWDWDIVANTLVWDDTTRSIYGMPADAQISLRDLCPLRIHPDDRDRVSAALDAALTSNARFRTEFRIVLPDGAVRHVATDSQTLRDRDGRPLRMVGVNFDITESKRAEREKELLHSQLSQAQKLEALGTLAGGIAHDFNNLLTSILGNAELARLDIESDSPALHSIAEIRKAGHRAKELVSSILAFGRPVEPTRKAVKLRPIVEEVFGLLRATIPASVDLSLQVEDDSPPILADASQIHQAVMNLATNSWHALENRPGRIFIRVGSCQVDTRLSETSADLHRGPYALISVIDSGKGMDKGTVARIFEPFFTTKPIGQGTGLGLSIVHGIMKAHEGAVTVLSEPGLGTTFNLYFPIADARETERASEAAPVVEAPESTATGQRILYLDDETYLVDLTKRMLTKNGFVVSAYSHVEDALEAFEADPAAFDLVVTDMNMPVMSGLDFAAEVLKRAPRTRIVLVSGFLKADEIDRARALGIAEIVDKPSNVETLSRVLRKLCP